MRNTAERVAADLVAAGLVEPGRALDAESVVARSLGAAPDTAPRPGGARSGLVEIAGYVGGALVLAALGLFLAESWSSLSDAMQVLLLAVVALLLAGAGLVVARSGGGVRQMRQGRDDVRRRLTSALLSAAAGSAALAVGVQTELLVDEDFSSWPGLTGGLALLVLAWAGYAFAPSALGQLAIAGAALTAIFSGLSVIGDDSFSALVPGLCVLALAAVWVAGAETGWFREPRVARSLGVAMGLFGAQLPMLDRDHHVIAYALTTGVAVVGFLLYLRTVSWPYLVAGVAGVTLVVPEAVIDWTDGSLGVAGAVLVAGLTLLGASLAGLRIRREAAD